jgi:quercetin dioxygenase-like cupin family protein
MAEKQVEKPHRKVAGHEMIGNSLRSLVLQYDLWEEVKRLREDDTYVEESGRRSITLVKHPDLRVVLVFLEEKAQMHEHKATARISIQALTGHIRLHLPDRTVDLTAGQLLALDQCVPHDVEAREQSAFLLTLSWPPEEVIEQCKTHRATKSH